VDLCRPRFSARRAQHRAMALHGGAPAVLPCSTQLAVSSLLRRTRASLGQFVQPYHRFAAVRVGNRAAGYLRRRGGKPRGDALQPLMARSERPTKADEQAPEVRREGAVERGVSARVTNVCPKDPVGARPTGAATTTLLATVEHPLHAKRSVRFELCPEHVLERHRRPSALPSALNNRSVSARVSGSRMMLRLLPKSAGP